MPGDLEPGGVDASTIGSSAISVIGSMVPGASWLSSAASALGALGGLFGGKGKSASKMMEEQEAWRYHEMMYGPGYQVAGLRRAGLNPIMLASKGFPQTGGPSLPSTQDDRSISLGKSQLALASAKSAAELAIASATVDNLKADTAKKYSEKDLADASIPGKQSEPEAIVARAGLDRANTDLVAWEAAQKASTVGLQNAQAGTAKAQEQLLKVESWIKGLEYQLAKVNLPERQRLELEKLRADLRTKLGDAAEGDFNAWYWTNEMRQAMEGVKKMLTPTIFKGVFR